MLTKSSRTDAASKTVEIQQRAVADARQWFQDNPIFASMALVGITGAWVVHRRREPWLNCPIPELRAKLESEGPTYTLFFLGELRNAFQRLQAVLVNVRYSEGVSDGTHWAKEFSAPEQLHRLQDFLTNLRNRSFLLDSHFYQDSWTPAHEILVDLLGDAYPLDDEGNEYLTDCEEFRGFWQPFVDEPMANVMATLGSGENRHKLQDRNYVLGFIDGALGLSKQMEIRLSDRRPIDVS